MAGKYNPHQRFNRPVSWNFGGQGFCVYPKDETHPTGFYFPGEPAFEYPTVHPYPPKPVVDIQTGEVGPKIPLKNSDKNLSALASSFNKKENQWEYTVNEKQFLQSGNQFYFPRTQNDEGEWKTTGDVYSWWHSPAGDYALSSTEVGCYRPFINEGILMYIKDDGSQATCPLFIYKNGETYIDLDESGSVISGFAIKKIKINEDGVESIKPFFIICFTNLETFEIKLYAYTYNQKLNAYEKVSEFIVHTPVGPNNRLSWPCKFSYAVDSFAILNEDSDDAYNKIIVLLEGAISEENPPVFSVKKTIFDCYVEMRNYNETNRGDFQIELVDEIKDYLTKNGAHPLPQTTPGNNILYNTITESKNVSGIAIPFAIAFDELGNLLKWTTQLTGTYERTSTYNGVYNISGWPEDDHVITRHRDDIKSLTFDYTVSLDLLFKQINFKLIRESSSNFLADAETIADRVHVSDYSYKIDKSYYAKYLSEGYYNDIENSIEFYYIDVKNNCCHYDIRTDSMSSTEKTDINDGASNSSPHSETTLFYETYRQRPLRSYTGPYGDNSIYKLFTDYSFSSIEEITVESNLYVEGILEKSYTSTEKQNITKHKTSVAIFDDVDEEGTYSGEYNDQYTMSENYRSHRATTTEDTVTKNTFYLKIDGLVIDAENIVNDHTYTTSSGDMFTDKFDVNNNAFPFFRFLKNSSRSYSVQDLSGNISTTTIKEIHTNPREFYHNDVEEFTSITNGSSIVLPIAYFSFIYHDPNIEYQAIADVFNVNRPTEYKYLDGMVRRVYRNSFNDISSRLDEYRVSAYLPDFNILNYSRDQDKDFTRLNSETPSNSFCIDYRYKEGTPMPWLISSSLHAISQFNITKIDYDLAYSNQGKVQDIPFKPTSKDHPEFTSNTLTLHPIGLY